MRTKFPTMRRAAVAAVSVAMAGVLFSGCTMTSNKASASAAEQRQELNSATDATLTKLYETSPQARELVQRAKGVLVFPSVLSASFIVGAEHGKGVLRVNGADAGYYSTTGGSIGLQAGAQSKAVVLLFMTDEALQKFRNSNGWTVGADATVAIANVGANGSIDSNTVRQPVVGFVMNNGGLMAGVSLDGSKISKVNL
ncbi:MULTISPECIES: YSC84-related protein [unclassified Bordetella]|uniref:BPSL1445 family SYLF domain-containing lipoprotein n=1 Tax=unclassified Bordetella TaxID=2630031 RepID=UPI00132434F4|nr:MULTISPECIES: YSC84-related protein [unclassified Bordetella]MVW72202.1 twin-arginine translocation pathway signal [Bordetella sp. 15P40C-2]MVW78861.1 twin-arginine translocation pathway signal [Bordetella sp. 02P26C-1]